MQRLNRKAVGIVFAGILVIGIVVLICLYRIRLRLALDVLVEETGSKKAAAICLVIALLALVCAICWMVFPILVYLGLKDLTRRVVELDETTRLCARHLSQLTMTRNLPEEKKAADQTTSSRSAV